MNKLYVYLIFSLLPLIIKDYFGGFHLTQLSGSRDENRHVPWRYASKYLGWIAVQNSDFHDWLDGHGLGQFL